MDERPDTSDLEARLWRSAHEEMPAARVREQALAAALAVGGAGGGGGGGGSTNAPPSPGAAVTANGVTVGWKLAATVAVLVGAFGVLLVTRVSETPSSAAVAVVASSGASGAAVTETAVVSAAVTASAPSEVAAASPVDTASAASATSAPSEPRAQRPSSSSAPRTSAPAPRGLTLADEIVAIDTARALLVRGDAAGALRSLDAYDKSFPRGELAPEAAALRTKANRAVARVDGGAP